MKYILFLIVLLPFFSNLKSADLKNNRLNRIILNWDSFVKVKNENMPYIAYTTHKTIYKYHAKSSGAKLQLDFEVSVLLDTAKTIVQVTKFERLDDNSRAALLKHEQGHSDLAVIYGRKLYKEFVKGIYSQNDYKRKTRDIYEKVMRELADVNIKYDSETQHGNDPKFQKIWDKCFLENL